MTLPDYDTKRDSNRRPKPDGLVEWLEAAIAGEPEAEAVIEAVQEARDKARAFDWLERLIEREGSHSVKVRDRIGTLVYPSHDEGRSLLEVIKAEMERKR